MEEKIPATSIAPMISEENEDAIWFSYLELVEKHKELIEFAKSIGVHALYAPRQKDTTTH